MDIVAYLRMLRRHWKLIVAAALLGAVVGAASTLITREPEAEAATFHKATHTLFLDTSNLNNRIQPIYTNLDQIAVLVTTGEVPRRVAAKLGGDPTELTSHVFTITNGTTNTLDIICAERSGGDAVTCADTFATELLARVEELETARFTNERDETTEQLTALEGQIAALNAEIAANPLDATIQQRRRSIENAYGQEFERLQQFATQGGPPTVVSTLEAAQSTPISQSEYDDRIARGRLGENRIRADLEADEDLLDSSADDTTERFSGPAARGILGGLLGLMLGVGLAVVADRADHRLRTREDVETAFGLPVLAEIPALTTAQKREASVVSASAPLSPTAEAYRAVRSSLMFQRATDAQLRRPGQALVVLVGSAGPKEGKTTTSANLATMFAETGQRVLAINCDFRRPTLHECFGLPNTARQVFETSVPNLWVVTDVTPGPSRSNPALVLDEQRRLVDTARSRFDVIVLDTAPMLTTNDATEIMASADLVVITTRVGITTSDGAQRARELLSRIAAPVSGVVLLGSEAPTNDYYYYYARGRMPSTTESAEVSAMPDDAWPSPAVATNGSNGTHTNGRGEVRSTEAEPPSIQAPPA